MNRRRLQGRALCWLVVLLSAVGGVAEAQPAAEPKWRGAAGSPLPFRSDAELVEFLRTARVVDEQKIGTGINESRKLLLEKDGIRANAVFREVNRRQERARIDGTTYRFFADSYLFEPAAYELARLLGLESVPPAVVRTVGRRTGSAQIWIEDTIDERGKDFQPPSATAWAQQVQDMDLFDNLVYNIDRNAGNLLVGPGYRLWMIDHTRAFQFKATLLNDRITRVRRTVWERLSALTEDALRARLSAYLTNIELTSLWRRREAILAHVEELVARRGEEAVFFD